MKPADVEKLLGGYATGTLTAEERRALMEAALEDQHLFDTLAREEALRQVLSDSAARVRLLAALEPQPAPWYRSTGWWMPAGALAAAALAVAVVAGYWMWHPGRRPTAPEVAVLRPAAIPAPPPAVARKPLENAPRAKQPRVAMEPAPAESDALRRNAPASHTGKQAKMGVSAGVQSSFGVTGSLTPPPPSAAPAPAPPLAAPQALSTSESVEVTAEARPVMPPAAGSNFRPARAPVMSQLAGVAPGPVRWTILRRGESGSFEPIAPTALQSGDTIELRLESTLEGDLSLSEGGPASKDAAVLLAPLHIAPGQAIVTPPLAPAGQGLRPITLHLTRTEGAPISIVVPLNYR